MSEQTQDGQKNLVIALVVVAALLAAIIGVLVYQKSTAIPAPSVSTAPTNTGTAPTGGTTGGAGGAAGGTGAPAAAFDPKSATKLPKGTEPKDYVDAYYKACEKGDWKAAFDALPNDKKAGNSPEALEQQVSGYGIKSYQISGEQVEGDRASILVDQVTESYGTFVNTWTFVKKDGAWLVESKAVTGMR